MSQAATRTSAPQTITPELQQELEFAIAQRADEGKQKRA